MTHEEMQAVIESERASAEKQRKADAELIQKLIAEQEELSSVRNREQLSKRKEILEAAEKAQIAAAAAAEAQLQKEKADRVALEQQQSILIARADKEQAQREELQKSIEDAKFVNEQHKKTQENEIARLRALLAAKETSQHSINVEHPEAPLNAAHPGEAVVGTEGSTP